MDRIIKYAVNPDKTIAESPDLTAELHTIDNVVEYAADEMKTEKHLYVTGINCNRFNAAERFTHDLARLGKKGERVCYHAYQSFAKDETDAHTAHEIGKKLAAKLWGETYRVLIATHCNTGIFHNH